MSTRYAFHCIVVVGLMLGAIPLRAQSIETLRNDAYHYEVREVDGVRLFVVDEVHPVYAREVRVPRRTHRIPLQDGLPPNVVVQDARLAEPVDAMPFYLVAFSWGADSVMQSRIVPY
jgi:hypothetical protein